MTSYEAQGGEGAYSLHHEKVGRPLRAATLLVHRSAEDVTTDRVAARAALLAHFAAVHADLAAVGEHLEKASPETPALEL